MKQNYRRCVSCRQIGPKEAFWRMVRVYPSHQVQLDQGMGRSAYLCPQANCLKVAQKKNRLGRSLKTSVPLEVYQLLWERLSEQMSEAKLQLSRNDTLEDDTASQTNPTQSSTYSNKTLFSKD